jgi:hypothetical protein
LRRTDGSKCFMEYYTRRRMSIILIKKTAEFN